jgi:hypothetical protein
LREVRESFDTQYVQWVNGHFLVRDSTGAYVPLQDDAPDWSACCKTKQLL